MPRFNNRSVGGQPTTPYPDFNAKAGTDVWLPLTFIDRNGVPEVPVTLTYRVDDLTNALLVQDTTSVTPTGSSMELNFPGAMNILNYGWRGTQLNQILVTATFADGSVDKEIFILELDAIATVGGAGQ